MEPMTTEPLIGLETDIDHLIETTREVLAEKDAAIERWRQTYEMKVDDLRRETIRTSALQTALDAERAKSEGLATEATRLREALEKLEAFVAASSSRVLGQIDDATARALVLHFGIRGAIDYATKIFQMGGPLAKEYGWLADYLTTYKAATEVGRWPKEFER